LFQVEIENGHFRWKSARTAVTVPLPADHVPLLEREKFISDQMQRRQALTRKRNALLAAAKLLVGGAIRDSLSERVLLRELSEAWVRNILDSYIEAGPETKGVAQARYIYHLPQEVAQLSLIDFIAQPLIEEGLVRQIRDPVFKYRTDPQYRLPGNHLPDEYHNAKRDDIPIAVLPSVTWQDFLVAIAHEQDSRIVGTAPPKGIFVVDSQGRIFAGTKLRGIFHHTSFVRAHGVLCAGSVVVRDGILCKFSPHSGHYTPRASDVQRIVQDWAAKGVNIQAAEFKGYDKS